MQAIRRFSFSAAKFCVDAPHGSIEKLFCARGARLALFGAAFYNQSLGGAKAFDGLRDRVLAVVLIDPELADRQDWLTKHFNHQDFDTELARPTGWFQLRFLETHPSVQQVADRALGLPIPPKPESGRVSIELVELGLLPGRHKEAAGRWLSRGLVVTVLAWLGSRG